MSCRLCRVVCVVYVHFTCTLCVLYEWLVYFKCNAGAV